MSAGKAWEVKGNVLECILLYAKLSSIRSRNDLAALSSFVDRDVQSSMIVKTRRFCFLTRNSETSKFVEKSVITFFVVYKITYNLAQQ